MSAVGSLHSTMLECFGLAIEVASDDRELIDQLPSRLGPAWRAGNGTPPSARFTAMRDGTITLDGVKIGRTDGSLPYTLAVLGPRLRNHLALHAPAHIFIHAGVVRACGVGVVIPGSSMSGKTTLVAELVRAGATYYSDEYAVVDESGLVHPYPNPLSLRLDPRTGESIVPVPVPDSQLGVEPIRVSLIVVTRYEQGGHWRPSVHAPGEGAMALLQHTVAARPASKRALAATTRVARGTKVLIGPRGEASLTASSLLDAVGSRAGARP